jgi:hypothetical protein
VAAVVLWAPGSGRGTSSTTSGSANPVTTAVSGEGDGSETAGKLSGGVPGSLVGKVMTADLGRRRSCALMSLLCRFFRF